MTPTHEDIIEEIRELREVVDDMVKTAAARDSQVRQLAGDVSHVRGTLEQMNRRVAFRPVHVIALAGSMSAAALVFVAIVLNSGLGQPTNLGELAGVLPGAQAAVPRDMVQEKLDRIAELEEQNEEEARRREAAERALVEVVRQAHDVVVGDVVDEGE